MSEQFKRWRCRSKMTRWIPDSLRYMVALLVAMSFLAYASAASAEVLERGVFHLVADAPEISAAVQAFKRHTAKEIVAWAERSNDQWLLSQFAYFKKRHKRDSRYQVWQEGAHPQWLQNDAMLEQKINYIHENPVRRGWVDSPQHWLYSSARNFYLEDDSILEIDPVRP